MLTAERMGFCRASWLHARDRSRHRRHNRADVCAIVNAANGAIHRRGPGNPGRLTSPGTSTDWPPERLAGPPSATCAPAG